jgi:hypothetical protein
MKNDKELLNEDFLENALMVAGFIPVIGEVADIILIIRYLIQGKYLYAGLMLIALIPTVGDIIAKPFIYLLKGRRATNLALRNTDELVKYLERNPEAKKMYMRLANHIDNPLIGKTINQVEKVPGIGGKAAEGMRESIRQHASVLGGIFKKPINIGKSIGKEIDINKGSFLKTVTGTGPVAMGIKKYFRGERLAKYLEKNGRVPSNWLSYWWNIVYKGSRDRKAYIRKFIIANNLLDAFGIPSLTTFEERFENDANFRAELAQNSAWSGLVGDITTDDDLDIINSKSGKAPKKMSNITKFFGLNFLKNIAQNL